MIGKVSGLSFKKGFRTIGVANKQELAIARALRIIADKVQDPKHKGKDPIKVWTQIFSEAAEELENGYSKDET